ncbi:MAG: hypothetical protein QM724_06625 [Flavobacteriales bacterium]
MGFGFNLLFLPMLLICGVASLIYIWLTPAERRNEVIRSIAWLSVAGFLGLVVVLFLGRWNEARTAPIQPGRTDIIGEYRVDTNMFNGFQARWQYGHHRILITSQDSLILEILGNGQTTRRYARAMKADDVAGLFHYRWHFKDAADSLTHHIIGSEPVMYRQHSGFYYVFHSARYGNMFFRKED